MNEAQELISAAKYIILDFDGPICRLLPPPKNLEAARTALSAASTLTNIPQPLSQTEDHLDVLKWAEPQPDILSAVTEACRLYEIKCATEAYPEPGTVRLMQATTKPIIILSNNHGDAVKQFLSNNDLNVNKVYGRPNRPSKMKPHPGGLQECIASTGLTAKEGVFIGDSQTDIDVAKIVNIPVIALRPNQADLGELTDADAYTTTL